MTEAINVAQALANLKPKPKARSKTRAIIEENLEAIFAAKDRQCTWEEIAETLREARIEISPDALRIAVSEIGRDRKKYPRTNIRRSTVRKPKRRTPRKPVEAAAEIAVVAPGEGRHDDRSAGKPETTIEAPSETQPKPLTKETSNSFAGIRRLNART